MKYLLKGISSKYRKRLTMYFLIEHDRTSKKTSCTEFHDYVEAQHACLQKEQEHFHAQRPEMEVVVFEANSIEDLKRTHGRYFPVSPVENKGNAAEALLAVGLIGLAIYLMKKK
ncbi:hypothetical protein KIK84_03180 [Curvibacter sp. CHRR-16]|uniref:hypothetical protein n=1 Tax=Curvibacter sp. CHRR-16 TaxID=2835872 RepID=UPI001BDA242B|nr:hypothetical protein [Curvibacter sp. CHRR-16]MBT0569315.1 hypothetical protein [Curvibacter sp. CHRR-16]